MQQDYVNFSNTLWMMHTLNFQGPALHVNYFSKPIYSCIQMFVNWVARPTISTNETYFNPYQSSLIVHQLKGIMSELRVRKNPE